MEAFAGIDVAFAKNKYLPISICVRIMKFVSRYYLEKSLLFHLEDKATPRHLMMTSSENLPNPQSNICGMLKGPVESQFDGSPSTHPAIQRSMVCHAARRRKVWIRGESVALPPRHSPVHRNPS